MVRAASVALIALGLAASLAAPFHAAGAQTLRRLHVDALGMHADRAVAQVGTPIHVTIHVHVREKLARLDEVVLPDLSDLEILGDERRLRAGAGGTDYVELLTVTATAPGVARLTPAHLDAIDARTGVPTRFSSNALTIRIAGAEDPAALLRGELRTLLRWLLVALAVAAAALVAAAFFRLRRRRPPSSPPPPAPGPLAAVPRPDPAARLAAALARLRARPSRAEALETRAALRDVAGARPEETLAEVLARLDGATALRGALRLAERAAFVDDARLPGSIDELVPAAEGVLVR